MKIRCYLEVGPLKFCVLNLGDDFGLRRVLIGREKFLTGRDSHMHFKKSNIRD